MPQGPEGGVHGFCVCIDIQPESAIKRGLLVLWKGGKVWLQITESVHLPEWFFCLWVLYQITQGQVFRRVWGSRDIQRQRIPQRVRPLTFCPACSCAKFILHNPDKDG